MANLYNISNHMRVKWSYEMVEAAKELGEYIIDVPYPNIPTDADDEEVRYIAAEFLGKLEIQPGDKVYIQGEMSSLYAMVHMLHKKGIECYTATSERRVWENSDGTTTRRFEFVRFRKYPNFHNSLDWEVN